MNLKHLYDNPVDPEPVYRVGNHSPMNIWQETGDTSTDRHLAMARDSVTARLIVTALNFYRAAVEAKLAGQLSPAVPEWPVIEYPSLLGRLGDEPKVGGVPGRRAAAAPDPTAPGEISINGDRVRVTVDGPQILYTDGSRVVRLDGDVMPRPAVHPGLSRRDAVVIQALLRFSTENVNLVQSRLDPPELTV